MRIREPQDQAAWGEFVRLYAPLIHSYGMHRGLQDADAADLVQTVISRVSTAAPEFRYDPSRGQFRAWLLTVTRNELLRIGERRAGRHAVSGGSEVRQLLEQHPDDREDEAYWDREYQWNLFEWAARKVQAEFRDTIWRAFWATAVENRETPHVARELGISVGAVYIARSRILARIREEINNVEGE